MSPIRLFCVAAASAALFTLPAHADALTPQSDGEKQALQWFRMLDGNGDGRLSHDEVQWLVRIKPSLSRYFKDADANGDGLVTPDEIRTLSAKRLAERRKREAAERAAAEPADAADPASKAVH